MADADFNLLIRTTADTSGIAQTEAALGRLSHGGFAQPFLAPVPPELLTTVETSAEATEKVAQNALFAGANMARLRNETVTFVRELASGAPTARTLGALLGSLGPSLIGGALAGLVLKNSIEQVTKETEKVTAELAKEGEEVVDLGRKWQEAAKLATSPEDVQKIAASGISAIDEVGKRLRQAASQDLTPMQTALDLLATGFKNAFTFGGDPSAEGPFKKLQDELVRGLGIDSELLRKQAHEARLLAEEYQNTYEAAKVKPAQEAIADLTKKIDEQSQKLKNAKTDEEWYKASVALQHYKAILAEIIGLEKQHQVELDKVTNKADAQVKAIVANEQSAAAARVQGDQKSAEQFDKSAEQFRAGATPQQNALADWIQQQQKNLTGQTQAPIRFNAGGEAATGTTSAAEASAALTNQATAAQKTADEMSLARQRGSFGSEFRTPESLKQPSSDPIVTAITNVVTAITNMQNLMKSVWGY